MSEVRVSVEWIFGDITKYVYVICRPERSILGKTVPEGLSTQDRGHSFSQYEPTYNMFIFYFRRVLCKQFLC